MSAHSGRRRLRRALPSFGTWWWLAALIAFVLVDTGLVVWALSTTNAKPVTQGAIPVEYFMPATEATVEPVDLVVAPRQLAAVDADTAWRTSATSCPADTATVEWTTNGGRSWDVATLDGTSTVIDLVPGTVAKVGALVASSEDCTLRYRTSTDSGATWGDAIDRIPGVDVVDPLAPGVVRIGDAQLGAPCLDPTVLTMTPGGPALLCATGDSYLLTDETWESVDLPGTTLALMHDGDQLLGLLSGAPDCADGLAVLAPDAVPVYGEPAQTDGTGAAPTATDRPIIGHDDELRACLDLDPAAPIAATTALDGTLWLWAGDTVARSADGGTTWSGLR